jgi:hypothetical protein
MASVALLDSGMSFSTLCICHRGPSCLANPSSIPHCAGPLLAALQHHGASTAQGTANWPLAQIDDAALRGPHCSTNEHVDFLCQEFSDMVLSGQWLVLPYSLVRNLPNLRLSPTGVIPQRDRRPQAIVDYSYSGVNKATILEALDSIQFGNALNHSSNASNMQTLTMVTSTWARRTSLMHSCGSGSLWPPSRVLAPSCPLTRMKSP